MTEPRSVIRDDNQRPEATQEERRAAELREHQKRIAASARALEEAQTVEDSSAVTYIPPIPVADVKEDSETEAITEPAPSINLGWDHEAFKREQRDEEERRNGVSPMVPFIAGL